MIVDKFVTFYYGKTLKGPFHYSYSSEVNYHYCYPYYIIAPKGLRSCSFVSAFLDGVYEQTLSDVVVSMRPRLYKKFSITQSELDATGRDFYLVHFVRKVS